ncbi:glucosamine--fructose-6-phosphate aminotransferase, partial [Listeria monocytogenes]|nr:glucosamine--fructose-6-phosphate aminotransferase [Listeria monocytogenes]
MKNMDYYIRSEQNVYENIIRSRKDLLQKVIQMEK